ncbi:hypothetical protein K501DRAFT_280265 [Backusella circina FSU 941]|nr:hypothetical protein K501DRAFT_280265 [Backusella circina FSU 941]
MVVGKRCVETSGTSRRKKKEAAIETNNSGWFKSDGAFSCKTILINCNQRPCGKYVYVNFTRLSITHCRIMRVQPGYRTMFQYLGFSIVSVFFFTTEYNNEPIQCIDIDVDYFGVTLKFVFRFTYYWTRFDEAHIITIVGKYVTSFNKKTKSKQVLERFPLRVARVEYRNGISYSF